NQLQTKTASDIADLYGLPKNWLQTAKETPSDLTESVPEEGQNAAGSQRSGKTKKSDKAVGIGFPQVVRKQLRNKALSSSGAQGVNATTRGTRNYQAALNAVQFYQDGYRIAGNWIHNLKDSAGGLLSHDWLTAGDFTFAVTKALDKIRSSVYRVQI